MPARAVLRVAPPVFVIPSLGGPPWSATDVAILVADTGCPRRNSAAARQAIAHLRAFSAVAGGHV